MLNYHSKIFATAVTYLVY